MNIFRLYACDSRLIDRRLDLFVESTGCCAACGRYTRLTSTEVVEYAALDERLLRDRQQILQLAQMAEDGYSVYLLEAWCRFESGLCPHPGSSCQGSVALVMSGHREGLSDQR